MAQVGLGRYTDDMKRKLIWLVAAFGVLVGTAAMSAQFQAASGACHKKCYEAKSTAYQRCRAIPPTNRAERTQCFRGADAALEACLKRCK